MNQNNTDDVAYLSTEKLALSSTQLGIFLADHRSNADDLYSIAHCIELPKTLNIQQFKYAIQLGLNEADSVVAQYSNQQEYPYLQFSQHNIDVECFDFRHLTPQQAIARVWGWMPSDRDAAKSLNTTSGRLYRQVLFITHDTVFWYQRYHHIMLDGFSFVSLSRRILDLYKQLQCNIPLSDSPFVSLEQALEERHHYKKSENYQKDKLFWTNYCQKLVTPVSLSNKKLSPTITSRFIQHQIKLSSGILDSIQTLARQHKLTVPDLMMALSLYYLGYYTQQSTLAVGVAFMRRLGSQAIRATLPRVNILPVQFSIQAHDSWLSLAEHVQQQIHLIRSHQHYDADDIVRDLENLNIHQCLYGPILNYKVFDHDLGKIENETVYTHHISTGPIRDFEFSFMVQQGELLVTLRGDTERYQRHDLHLHASQLSAWLEQCLIHPEQQFKDFNLVTLQHAS